MTAAGGDPRAEWAFLGRRVLVVSRFPPAADGIARYAAQLNRLLAEDRELLALGIPQGGGDRVRALWGGLRPLRIALHARGFDDVLVQYHPHYFVRGAWPSRVASYAALALVARACPTTWVVHEFDEPRAREIGRRGRIQFAAEEALRCALWRRAGALVFHSEADRRRFAARFPGRRAERVVSHGAFFVPETDDTREQARAALGLGGDRAVLLMIGFLSPHKGYDRAIAAFADAAGPRAELHVVGTPIRPMPDVHAHVEQLRRLVAATPGVHLHERFVGDEEFDRWIRAADAVITPYREAASSGVMARARMLGTPVITSAAGGLAEQVAPGDVAFTTQAELAAAIRAATAPPPPG